MALRRKTGGFFWESAQQPACGQIGFDGAQDLGLNGQVEQGLSVTLSRIRCLGVVRHVLKYPLCSLAALS